MLSVSEFNSQYKLYGFLKNVHYKKRHPAVNRWFVVILYPLFHFYLIFHISLEILRKVKAWSMFSCFIAWRTAPVARISCFDRNYVIITKIRTIKYLKIEMVKFRPFLAFSYKHADINRRHSAELDGWRICIFVVGNFEVYNASLLTHSVD